MTTLDTITTELNKRLDVVTTKIEMWEKVKRRTKKDGSDFASLAKNFEGVTIYDASYSMVPTKEITVTGWTKYSGWISDKIENRALVRYETHRNIAENRIIKENFLEPYYYKTVDEIFEDIEIHIKTLKTHKEQYEKSIEIAPRIFKNFKEQIDTAVKELKENADGSLYYLCLDYAKSVH